MAIKKYQQLKKYYARISHLQYAQRILMWDEAVMMPEGAQEARASAVATLNLTIHRMLTAKRMKSLIDQARHDDTLETWDAMNLKLIEKKYIRSVSLPSWLAEESAKAAILCEQAWRKLRPENNWKDFLPFFEKVFNLVREAAEREGQALGMTAYDALLDLYAPGFSQKNIDIIFSQLKQALHPLVTQIIGRQSDDAAVAPVGPFPVESQRNLGLAVMNALCFDFTRGRLDISHHPFCSGGPSDVRMTTRYTEHEFLSSLFGICHETGHALYEQGLPGVWVDQPVGQIDSMVMHESQSLLIEMEVCRSMPFIKYLQPLLVQRFGDQPAFTFENLFRLVTRVTPGYIRVDADEVTYPMHVMLRYELEKALFSGELSIQDLPAAWNDLMVRYLGLSTAGNVKNGVMQDVHWPGGAFGYFPAYTLGRMMAAQLFTVFSERHPHSSGEVQSGKFNHLHNWLSENIYQAASSLPVQELLTRITGKPLEAGYFLDHIRARYLGG
ncbi:Thermostable carboxypeptidase 1 [Aquicella siphonis]|uniref:Metal-dependent carboxypeptidase n=1 Tax=Aquicella siphonis TaxID=254247 RepID=A0A5E4PGT2_9COXI|nr:carboxypeptidase M32 [Aquicella siphonis]VVC75667.1 Thermostable carboxypeptidase 1 [Aquicella siphonis]